MAHKRADELYIQMAQYIQSETNANLLANATFTGLTFESIEPLDDISWEETPIEADINVVRNVGSKYGKQVIPHGGKLSFKLRGRGLGGGGVEDTETTGTGHKAEAHFLLESAFGILSTYSEATGGASANEDGSKVVSGTTTAITLPTGAGVSFEEATPGTHYGAIMIENSADTFGECRKVVYRSGDVVSVSHAFVNADYNTANQPVFRGREYRRNFINSPFNLPTEFRHLAFKIQDQADTSLDSMFSFFGCLPNFSFSFSENQPLVFNFEIMASKVLCDNTLWSALSFSTNNNSPTNSIESNTYSDLVFLDPDDSTTVRRLTCVSGAFNLNNNLQPVKSIAAEQGIAGFMAFGRQTLQLRIEQDTTTIKGGALDLNAVWKNSSKFPVSLQLGSVPGNACLLYIPQAQIVGLRDDVNEGGFRYHDLTLEANIPATLGTEPVSIATGNPNGGNTDISFFLF